MLPSHLKHQPMTATRAEEIAARALAFLADDMARLTRFLSVTGLSPQVLRRDATSHGMLAAVLQYLADDESLLLVFASGAGLSPAEIGPALDFLQANPQPGDA
jgi:uncharacterized protein DUF3572